MPTDVGREGVSGHAARAGELSRRALIRAAPGLALGAVAAEAAGGPPGHPAGPVPHQRVPAQAARTSAPPVAPRRSPLPVQPKPIRTLAEYRSLVPGPAFPEHAVALTIDDGPHPVWTPPILRLLDRYEIA